MKVSQLIKLLQVMKQDSDVVLAKDKFANEISSLGNMDEYFVANGHIVEDAYTIEQCNAVILWPVN